MMPLDLSMLRLGTLFGTPPQQTINPGVIAPSVPPVDSSIQGDPSQAQPSSSAAPPDATQTDPTFQAKAVPPPPIAQYYTPQTELENRLKEALGVEPQRTDYPEASGLTKVLAHLSALRARNPIEASQIVDYKENQPYYRAEGDWRNKIDTLMKGANLERQQNVNERLFGSEAGKEVLRQEQIDINDKRADAQIAKWSQGNYDIKVIDGHAYALDKQTGDLNDTGITGITKEQELKLRNGYTLQQIAARGAQERQTKQTLGAGTTKPATAESGTSQKAHLLNRAKQAVNEHPEWANYIKFDPSGGTFTINPPSTTGWFGRGGEDPKSRALHDQIYSYIYGQESPTNQPDPLGIRKQ